MTKRMRDGSERAIFDRQNGHLKYHEMMEKAATTKQNFNSLQDRDFTEAVQIRPPPRATKDRLTYLATNHLYYKHNEGKKNTSWHCQYKCRGCNGLFLTRKIGGNVSSHFVSSTTVTATATTNN